MKRIRTALGLALLLALSAAACGFPVDADTEVPYNSAVSANEEPPSLSQWLQGSLSSSAEKTDEPEETPVKPTKQEKEPLVWTTEPVLTAAEMPDNHGGLELPVQGATGYASVELPLWREISDYEAARKELEEWERIKAIAEEKKREREAAEAAAAAAQAALLNPEGASANPAEAAPDASAEGEAASAAEPNAPAETAPAGTDAPTEAAPAETVPAETAPAAPEEAAEPLGEAPSVNEKAQLVLPAGTPFTVLREQDGWWEISCDMQGEDCTGWVEHRYCMINLPDVIPSIIYDATNGYSSRFVSCGKRLDGVTGQKLYTGAKRNERLGEKEFMMPVLYAMAYRLCEAQRAALAEGNCIVLYEGYRPLETQLQVCDALRALMQADEEVRKAVVSPPWNIAWFIATNASNHQHGYAVDMSLARVRAVRQAETGGYRYVRMQEYELYQMPTAIHELSRAAATFTGPVASNSPTAWKSATLAPTMNDCALGMQRYCTNASLTPLASEWWHFNDLNARSSVLGRLGTGNFEITVCRSTAP